MIQIVSVSSCGFDEGDDSMSAVDVTVTVLVTTLTQNSSRRKIGGTAETSAAIRKNARKNIGQAIILHEVTVKVKKKEDWAGRTTVRTLVGERRQVVVFFKELYPSAQPSSRPFSLVAGRVQE